MGFRMFSGIFPVAVNGETVNSNYFRLTVIYLLIIVTKMIIVK